MPKEEEKDAEILLRPLLSGIRSLAPHAPSRKGRKKSFWKALAKSETGAPTNFGSAAFWALQLDVGCRGRYILRQRLLGISLARFLSLSLSRPAPCLEFANTAEFNPERYLLGKYQPP